jgi:hypothetical protein
MEPDLGQILLERRDRHHGGGIGGIGGVRLFQGCRGKYFRRRTDLGELFFGWVNDLRFDRFYVEILLARTHDGQDYHKRP